MASCAIGVSSSTSTVVGLRSSTSSSVVSLAGRASGINADPSPVSSVSSGFVVRS
jgi:hypothetical protein